MCTIFYMPGELIMGDFLKNQKLVRAISNLIAITNLTFLTVRIDVRRPPLITSATFQRITVDRAHRQAVSQPTVAICLTAKMLRMFQLRESKGS